MRKIYLDVTEATSCMSVFVKNAEVIKAGTTIYAMQVKDKNSEYQRYAEEYDIHFIFKDNILTIEFYTIPQVDVFAVDSDGGLLGTVGCLTDFESDVAICYVSKDGKCYLIAENGKEFLNNVEQWKRDLEPLDDIEIFSSKTEAMDKYDFWGGVQ